MSVPEDTGGAAERRGIQGPATQVPAAQTRPEPQLVPSGAADHALVDAIPSQTWQGLAGLAAPSA
jgi:hypothetical protein